MVQVGQDDLLRALKGFKGLAKQDLLLTNDTGPQANYRKTHAEARREVYLRLIDFIETGGFENACVFAYQEYLKLPEDITDNPSGQGRKQALEMFFKVIGITPEQLETSKGSHLEPAALLATISPCEEAYCAL